MYFGSPESYEWYAKRGILYIRVSNEEQARHGYSLGAQLEALEEFASLFHMEVVGIYRDEGITARKEVHKRKGLSELLAAVERDETDYILFIKLDRWFRSVREYYRVQDILEAHKVNWKATMEDYDTSTTNGRLNLNIRLSIAQDESDRTGDRIRFVNESRVKNGGAIHGSYPIALFAKDGKVCVDEEKAPIVKAIYDTYETSYSVRACIEYVYNIFGVRLSYKQCKQILANTMYAGQYRDNKEYCPSIVSREQFERVRQLVAAQTGTRETTRTYIFRGLMRCPNCGRSMVGWTQHDPKYGRDYQRYRCNNRYQNNNCQCTQAPWEVRIEKYLLKVIQPQLTEYVMKFKTAGQKRKTLSFDTAKIKRQLDRLQSLYIEELIELDDYRKEYARLKLQLSEAETKNADIEKPRNFSPIETILNESFVDFYAQMDSKSKNVLWASILKCIVPINKDRFDVIFL